jgi:hypothetical protein
MTAKEWKEQYEIVSGEQFLDVLQCDRKFRGHRKDDDEPRFDLGHRSKTVGSEIMTIYVTTVRPRLSGKLSRGEIKREPRSSVVTGSWTEPDEPFLACMQQELGDKCAKAYSGVETVWLHEDRLRACDCSRDRTNDCVY